MGKRAAELAIAKARQCGIVWVGTRHSNSRRAGTLDARMPAAHDMIDCFLLASVTQSVSTVGRHRGAAQHQ